MYKGKEWLKEEIDEIVEFELDHRYGLMSDKYVSLHKLINLLNQLEEPEQEKVVVNEVMAGHIENCKNLKLTLSDSLHLVVSGDKKEEVLFARAWLDGYSVEKKRKYVVEDNKVALLCKFDGKVMPVSETIQDGLHHESLDYELTETEIKDYDERYWAFAEEVTK